MKRLIFSIVAMAGHYCGALLKLYRWVTQGNTISPTIFNMVVDAVIHHWDTVEGGRTQYQIGSGGQ